MARQLTWSREPLLRALVWLLNIFPGLLGATVLIGGYDRMASSSGFVVLLQWAPYYVWGSVAVALTVWQLATRRLVRAVGTSLAATYMWVWTSAVTASALTGPGPYTGVAVYTVMSIALTTLAIAEVQDHERQE